MSSLLVLFNLNEDDETEENFEVPLNGHPLNESFEDTVDYTNFHLSTDEMDLYQVEEEVAQVRVEDVGSGVEVDALGAECELGADYELGAVGELGATELAQVELQRYFAFKGREDFLFDKEYINYIITHAQVYNYQSF